MTSGRHDDGVLAPQRAANGRRGYSRRMALPSAAPTPSRARVESWHCGPGCARAAMAAGTPGTSTQTIPTLLSELRQNDTFLAWNA